jgi:hypothetical protein
MKLNCVNIATTNILEMRDLYALVLKNRIWNETHTGMKYLWRIIVL